MIEFIIGIALIVFWLMLFFAVLRIKNESIAINKRLRTLNMIMRELHRDALPGKPCPHCKTHAEWGQNNCSSCGQALEW